MLRGSRVAGCGRRPCLLDDPGSALPLYESARWPRTRWRKAGHASARHRPGGPRTERARPGGLCSACPACRPRGARSRPGWSRREHATGEQWGEALAAVEGAREPLQPAGMHQLSRCRPRRWLRPAGGGHGGPAGLRRAVRRRRSPPAGVAGSSRWHDSRVTSMQPGPGQSVRGRAEDPAYRVQAETLVGRLVAEEEETEEEEG